jgi:class 3 adenylate cyclase
MQVDSDVLSHRGLLLFRGFLLQDRACSDLTRGGGPAPSWHQVWVTFSGTRSDGRGVSPTARLSEVRPRIERRCAGWRDERKSRSNLSWPWDGRHRGSRARLRWRKGGDVDERPVTRYAKTVDGVHIAYQVQGAGPLRLLAVSGEGIGLDSGDDEPSFLRFQRRLASFSFITRFNARGFGLSDPVPGGPATLEQRVRDAMAVLDAVESEHAAVFASGASVPEALLLAVTHPERISHLVVVHGFARLSRAPDYPAGVPQRLIDEVNEIVTEPDAVDRGFDLLSIMAPSVADNNAFRTWWIRAGNRNASPAMALALNIASQQVDVRHLLPLVRVPTLILHRRDNRFIRVGHGRYLAEHIPGAKYVELAGDDHLYFVGDTDALIDEIEEFLTGRHQAPEGDVITETILFTDIVSSTEQSARLGHRRWTTLSDDHDAMVRATLARHRGREVKTIGDGFLATFDATTRGVRAATEIVAAAKEMGLQVRAGVHTGDVEVRPDDVVGLAVTIAKRICDLASAGQVLVSEAVKVHLVGSGIAVSEQGCYALKGVPDEWRLFTTQD